MITKPQLPPRKGYVEVETTTGEHIYQMTAEYKQQLEREALLDSLNTQTTDMQLAMTETYEDTDSKMTDVQLALCELYELIKGGTDNG